MNGTQQRRLRGTVVSTKMTKTAVVRVDRRVAHAKYKKMYTVSKNFKVHDPLGKAHDGDLIEFQECRPLSKDKCWAYVRTITAA